MSESKIEMLLSKFELYSASYANTGEERFFSKVNEVRAQIVEENKRLREALENAQSEIIPIRGYNVKDSNSITSVCVKMRKVLDGGEWDA